MNWREDRSEDVGTSSTRTSTGDKIWFVLEMSMTHTARSPLESPTSVQSILGDLGFPPSRLLHVSRNRVCTWSVSTS